MVIATTESTEIQIISEPSAQSYYVYSEVLLNTALVLVQDNAGEFIQCRALLDSGSQLSLIRQSCASRLKLPARHSHVHVSGVAGAKIHTIHQVSLVTMKSCVEPNFRCTLETFIVPRVTGPLPVKSFQLGKWPHVNILTMADPDYNLSKDIDLLLGADCLPLVMRSGIKVGSIGQPLAQYTAFGWVLLGPIALKTVAINRTSRMVEEGTDVPTNNGERGAEGPQRPRSAEPSEEFQNSKDDTCEGQHSRGHSNCILDWLLKSLRCTK